jgi:CrcB protein
MKLLLVCLAGGLGSGARYLLASWGNKALSGGFPYGTLLVNVIGCALIGYVMQLPDLSADTRLVLTTGFLGGFTTYSAFSFEASTLLKTEPALGVAYILITTLACVAVCSLVLLKR